MRGTLKRRGVSALAGLAVASVATFGLAAPAQAATFADALASVQNAAAKASSTGVPVVYQATPTVPLPARNADGTSGVVATTATLTIIPNASGVRSQLPRVQSRVLVDTHTGADARCEENSNAVVDDLPQTAELYTPLQAYAKLDQPDFLLNANYFEVRPQLSGTTWQSNRCSSPAGVYFDNHPGNETQNAEITGSDYFGGLPDFVRATGTSAPLDTLFIADEGSNGSNTTFELVTNSTLGSGSSLARAQELSELGSFYTAVSGTSLLPRAGAAGSATQPDSGSSSTTRIAIGYDRGNDRLLILQGGGYRNGFTRQSLTAVMRAANASLALELDGGGSAAVAFARSKVTFAGASTSPVSVACTTVCLSPVTQPSGAPRPVPAWLGIDHR